MKISFWLTSTTRIMTKDNWGNAPMGGAEISAVQLGEELLKLGHELTYYLQRCDPFDRENLHVRLHQQVGEQPHDYFICVRPHQILTAQFGDTKKILWSGDAFDQSSNEIFYNKATAESMTAFVFKSNWQREKILEKFYTIAPAKTHVIYNGIKKEYFLPNGVYPNPKRFIHTSTFYRGLVNFLAIWPMILKEIPDAEIHVFSKTSLYHGGIDDGKQQAWELLADKLVQIPGIVVREPVPQWILANEIKKAWLMLYPNSGFVESSCASVLQAIVSGTPVIATNRAGLPETIKDGGILIEQTDEDWKEKFAKATVELSRDTIRRQKMADYGHQRLQLESWDKKALEWQNFLESL